MFAGTTRHEVRAHGAGWIAAGLILLAAAPAMAQADPWAKGTSWMSVRFGYAKSTAAGAADGSVGAGFGFAKFHSAKWSYGGMIQFDNLGSYGSAHEMESSWTLELLRHYKWPTAARPYLGFGGGAYFNRVSGTGQDGSSIAPGYFLIGGMNTSVSEHGLIGFDVRASLVELDKQDNPVFGGEATLGKNQKRGGRWSAKVSYVWAF